jgi:hypothetical protein
MKSCLNCGTETLDDAVICDTCGRRFAYTGAAEEPQTSSVLAEGSRPDGSGAMSTGVFLAIAGILALAISAMTGTTEYGAIDPDKTAMKAALSLIGGGILQVGLVAWLAGYIVHALSFLPGRDN